MPLMILGMVMLFAGIPTHLCDHNAYLVLCVFLMVFGLVWFVVDLKRRSKY